MKTFLAFQKAVSFVEIKIVSLFICKKTACACLTEVSGLQKIRTFENRLKLKLDGELKILFRKMR